MRRLTAIMVWGLLVLAGIFAVVRFSGLLGMMLPAGEPPQFVFDPNSELPDTPNYFLSCPDGLAPRGGRQMTSPQFEASVEKLARAFIATAPDHGMKLTNGSVGAHSLQFLARSKVFQFPDWVELKLMSVPDQAGATFCLFAKSVYGRDDFQQNEKRTRAWLRDVRLLTSP
ncbi:DUF1499 domain-containing protein [Thalassospira sp. GB04J01]|uniref:DUF1499 domain-containing protein n=1 Tax=Thalassospira sp. GB04J01 TaxID=1485225 RepID=UPI0011AF4ED3|nr:DUF1499 domain-containing protein [Thalassospira sp. GB04J01]